MKKEIIKSSEVVFQPKYQKEKDYRKGQRVIATIEIEDKGQDFVELDVLENGVILGNNVMFSHGRLSLLGIGTLDGTTYYDFQRLRSTYNLSLNGFIIYLKNTGEKELLPWKAKTLKYRIVGIKKAIEPNRFKKLVKKVA